jgi:hypothetical protein
VYPPSTNIDSGVVYQGVDATPTSQHLRYGLRALDVFAQIDLNPAGRRRIARELIEKLRDGGAAVEDYGNRAFLRENDTYRSANS